MVQPFLVNANQAEVTQDGEVGVFSLFDDRIHAMPLFLGGGYPSMAPCFYGPVLLEELWIFVLRHWWIRDCLENGGHVWKIASPAFH